MSTEISGAQPTANLVWDSTAAGGAGAWVRMPLASSGSAVTISDGSNVVEGATADASITTDTTGTISGKLRGLVAILSSVWNSVSQKLRVDTGLTVQTDALTNTQLRASAVPVSINPPIDSSGTNNTNVNDWQTREVLTNQTDIDDRPDNAELDDALQLLAMSMDKANQMPQYVEVANPPKTDVNGNPIPSDAPAPIIWRSSVAASIAVINTRGYQTVMIQQLSAGAITPTTSNDGATWVGTSIMISANPAAILSATTGAGLWIMPVTGLYIKLTGPASLVDCIIYLRQTPFGAYLAQLVPQQNLLQINATPIVTAGVNGLLAVGGNIAAGTAPTSNPIPMGGKDNSIIPVTRMFRTNTEGALNVASGPPSPLTPNSMMSYQGLQPLMVMDIDDCEGNTQADLLGRILIELRTTNIILHEMAMGLPIDMPDVIASDMAQIN